MYIKMLNKRKGYVVLNGRLSLTSSWFFRAVEDKFFLAWSINVSTNR